MEAKKWIKIFFFILIFSFLFQAILIYIVDPYFHYHAPLKNLQYQIGNERYQNNGIIKNFEYDAMITGNSYTQNFKTTEFDELFGANSIKVAFSGAEYKETAEAIATAINEKNNLKCVLFGIAYNRLLNDKDKEGYENYPTYLYDYNIFNDYKYLASGEALKMVYSNIVYTIRGMKTTTFDEFSNWHSKATYGKESVLRQYERFKIKKESISLTSAERQTVKDNIKQNLVDVANMNKNIRMYYFLNPNSIVWWDEVSQAGTIKKYLEAEEIAIEMLLECENVKLYSFYNNYDLVCNLDNFKDRTHYSEDINSQILKWIKNDEYLLTKENYKEYLQKEREFYLNYNYDAIFE